MVDAFVACAADTPSCLNVQCSVDMVEMIVAHLPQDMLLVLPEHFVIDLAAPAETNCQLLLIAGSLSSLEIWVAAVHAMNQQRLTETMLEDDLMDRVEMAAVVWW